MHTVMGNVGNYNSYLLPGPPMHSAAYGESLVLGKLGIPGKTSFSTFIFWRPFRIHHDR